MSAIKMKKEIIKKEIIKKVEEDASAIIGMFRKEHAAMMAACWRGDTRARDEHRKMIDGMGPEIQATVGRLFSWATAQLKPTYTGGIISYGHGRGRICAAPSYAAPVRWLDSVEARAVVGAPSWETYASKEEAIKETISSIGNGNVIKIKVRDRPDPNDSWFSMTTVVETKESNSLKEAIKKADPKWGLNGFGPWEWNGEEISPETQAETILLQGESPFRGQWDGHKWKFDIAVR